MAPSQAALCCHTAPAPSPRVRHDPVVNRYAAALVVGAVVLVGAGWFILGRAGVEAASTVDPDVTIRCDGSTSVSAAACLAWGDDILRAGPPSHTFEMDDLARLDLTGGLFISDTCEVRYFLERYADKSVWTEELPCPGG